MSNHNENDEVNYQSNPSSKYGTLHASTIQDKDLLQTEILSDEEVPFILTFSKVKEKLKITAVEKNSMPQNIYENYFSMQDLIKINSWFKIFYNLNQFLIEVEILAKNQSFEIEIKRKKFLKIKNDLNLIDSELFIIEI